MSDGYEIVCSTCRSPFPAHLAACPTCRGSTVASPRTPPGARVPFAQSLVGTDATPLPATATVRPASLDLLRTDEVRYAGFWIRVAASLVDSLILIMASYMLQRMIGAGALAALADLVVGWLYYTYFESSSFQGTIGKVLFGLAVTNDRLERIGFGRANGRYFAKILSTIPLGIGFLMVGWTRRKQGLHDLVASTFVIRR
jgi:uncharacterized RDD family membrane protein YckC